MGGSVGVIILEESKPKSHRPAKNEDGKPRGVGRSYRSRDGVQHSERSRSDSRSDSHQGSGRREDRSSRPYGESSKSGAPRTGPRGSSRNRGDRPSSGDRPYQKAGRGGESGGRGYGRSGSSDERRPYRGSDDSDGEHSYHRSGDRPSYQRQGTAGGSGQRTVAGRASSPQRRNDGSNYSRSYRGTSQRANSAASSRNSPNRQNRRGSGRRKDSSPRQPMLNTHRVAPFKYDMKEILAETSMDPDMASSFLATVIAKASRISIRDAKDYVRTFVDAGNLTKADYDKFARLMDRYSKYR